jgi:hypothetical protein
MYPGKRLRENISPTLFSHWLDQKEPLRRREKAKETLVRQFEL